MGQYYVIANVDKREMIRLIGGNKLMEFAWLGGLWGGEMAKLVGMLHDAWCGDRVYVVGDYADVSEDGLRGRTTVWKEAMEDAGERLGVDLEKRVLYDCIMEDFKDVSGKAEMAGARMEEMDCLRARYIVNRACDCYVDLRHCPVEHIEMDNDGREIEVISIHPLALLLAMGNGEGGGDYYGVNQEAVGSWCSTSDAIRILTADQKRELKGLVELRPEFTERKTPIVWDERGKAIAEALKEKFETK